MAFLPEKISDLDIQDWVQEHYGFVPHPFWIRHCEELYLHAPTTTEAGHECSEDKRLPIKAAFQHFGMIREEPVV
jgi:hypothetical protein